MRTRDLLLAVVGLGLALPVHAQQLDRRSRDEPDISVEAGGRVGPCDVLLFSRDGSALFAAGDDKVVRVWPHGDAGLGTRGDQMQTLRWPAWREQRGGIKTMAVSADGKRVAVGGFGLIPSAVTVIDRETGNPVGLTWPRTREGEPSYFGSVTAVAFHPDGKRVGFATRDGSLWLWEPVMPQARDAEGRPSAAPRWVGRHTRVAGADGKPAEFNYPRLVHFPDADTLVSVAESGEIVSAPLAGELPELAAGASPAKPLFNLYDGLKDRYRAHRVERTADGKWFVVASAGPDVLLRSTDGKQSVRIALPVDHFARSIAVHPKTGKLAVGVAAALPGVAGQPRFYMEAADELWLFNNPTADTPRPTAKLPLRGLAEAVAFHPTENRIAVAGGDADEVTLFDLAAPQKPLSVARGAGCRLWGVKLSANGKVLAVQPARDPAATDPNRRGKADPESWALFDLPRRRVTKDAGQEWAEPLTTADGWSVVPDANDRFVWHASITPPGRPPVRFPLTLDRARDQAPTCFTFLPAKGNRPTRLLVGHYYGCSLFELTPVGATRVRLYTGHGGEVLSVVAARDGTWFVTAGADHTVAAWSLADWPGHPSLGAAFELKDGSLHVSAVDVGAPAWEAGLRVGDTVDLLAAGGSAVFDRRAGRPAVGSADAALAALARPAPGVELFFGLKAKDAPHRMTLTSVRQRPLWKWFPAFDADGRLSDWAVWMWHGSFYDTSTHGDRLVGWHVNHPEIVGGRPEFYPLERFKDQYHKRPLLDKLIGGRSVGEALRDDDALGADATPKPFRFREPAPPRLVLERTEVGADAVEATVVVEPRGSNPDLLPQRLELWLNDYRVAVIPGDGKNPVKKTVTIPAAAFRAGDNRLTLLTHNPAGGRGEGYVRLVNPRAADPTNLLGVAVGVNDYGDHRVALKRGGIRGVEEFTDLRYSRADAKSVVDQFHAFRGAGKFFPASSALGLRVDKQAVRKDLMADFDKLAKVARPDDLLVVFFAGHGCDPDALPGKPGAGGRGARGAVGRFVFCCPDFDPGKVDDTTFSAEDLFEALARVNCRKLVLLDACHSGGAAETNLVRRLIPDGQGPTVMAGCTQNQQSLEHPMFGHGLFTFAMIEAFGKDFRRADRNIDGALSADELFRYVSRKVPDLVDEAFPANKDGEKPAQNPICFPRELPGLVIVRH